MQKLQLILKTAQVLIGQELLSVGWSGTGRASAFGQSQVWLRWHYRYELVAGLVQRGVQVLPRDWSVAMRSIGIARRSTGIYYWGLIRYMRGYRYYCITG